MKNNEEKRSCETCLFMGVTGSLEAVYACMGCVGVDDSDVGWSWQPQGVAIVREIENVEK